MWKNMLYFALGNTKMIHVMLFQVENTDHGYVVSAYDPVRRDGWKPLRNFGDRQGDARGFMLYDAPFLPYEKTMLLAKNYNPKVKYIRICRDRYNRQQITEP